MQTAVTPSVSFDISSRISSAVRFFGKPEKQNRLNFRL